VYDCEIERCHALYNCLLKEFSDKGLKEILWGEVCEAVVSERSQLDSPEKHEKGKQCCFFNNLNTNAQIYINYCKIRICLTLQRKLTLAES
jgi:hypothetical protein